MRLRVSVIRDLINTPTLSRAIQSHFECMESIFNACEWPRHIDSIIKCNSNGFSIESLIDQANDFVFHSKIDRQNKRKI